MRALAILVALAVLCCPGIARALPRVVLPGNEAYFAQLLAGDPLPGNWTVQAIAIDHDVARYTLQRGSDRVELRIVERDAETTTERTAHLGLVLPGPPADAELVRELVARARAHDTRDPFSEVPRREGAAEPSAVDEMAPVTRVRVARWSAAAALFVAAALGVLLSRRSRAALPVLLASALVLCAVVHHAWLSDDATEFLLYARNVREGHGIVANVGHRVQGFTSPLWLLCTTAITTLAPGMGLYWLSLAATLCLLAAFAALGGALGLRTTLRVALLALAFGSESVLSFQTSGLEGSLLHALAVTGALCAVRAAQGHVRARRGAVCVAALLAVTRLDAVILSVPLIAVATAGRPTRREIAVAIAPLVAWLAFATVYFGYPLPVTWYAKTGGLALAGRLAMGWRYLADAARCEPLFLLGVVAVVLARQRRDETPEARALSAFALGALAYLPYLLFVGGDFMRGRLLVPLHLVCAPVLVQQIARWSRRDSLSAGAVAALVAVSFLASLQNPPGIVSNERRYYPEASLFRQGIASLASPPRSFGLPTDVSLSLVLVHDHEALALDPRAHLIHLWGLTDPFVARCPADDAIRPGHVTRRIPLAYLRARGDLTTHGGLPAYFADRAGTLERVAAARANPEWHDDAPRRLFEELEMLETAPVWSRARWALIPRFTFSSERLERVDDSLVLTPALVPSHDPWAPRAGSAR